VPEEECPEAANFEESPWNIEWTRGWGKVHQKCEHYVQPIIHIHHVSHGF